MTVLRASTLATWLLLVVAGVVAVQRAQRDLLTDLRHADADVRRCASLAVGRARIADAALVESLTGLLGDPSVRSAAAWALGELGPAAHGAVPALLELLRDGGTDELQRAHVALALGRIAGGSANVASVLDDLERRDSPLVGKFARLGRDATLPRAR